MAFNLEDYITVNERIIELYKRYPEASIQSEIIDHDEKYDWAIMRSVVYRHPDDPRPCYGHAQEWRAKSNVSKNALIENLETSSVGRAIAMMGIEVSKSIASREEILRSQAREADGGTPATASAKPAEPEEEADYAEKVAIFKVIASAHEYLGVAKDNKAKLSLLKESKVAGTFNNLTLEQLNKYAKFLQTKVGDKEVAKEDSGA